MSLKYGLVALAFLAAAPAAMATESLVERTEINGRTINEITSILANRDIQATGVERWGDSIRVQAVDADGSPYIVFVDRYTLRPLSNSNVGTNLDVGARTSAAQVSAPRSFAPVSLSLSSDND